MLVSVDEHVRMIDARAVDILQPDAPRVGGITPFLRLATLVHHAGLQLAPHFAMQIHLHLAAAFPSEPWVEHFEWLDPLFQEGLEVRDGRMIVPRRPGLGIAPSERCRAWTVEHAEFGRA
jgi:L-alanine-DL-glutamate epimerase-like enolase superfamily enzyme